jgi:hypothetical protein
VRPDNKLVERIMVANIVAYRQECRERKGTEALRDKAMALAAHKVWWRRLRVEMRLSHQERGSRCSSRAAEDVGHSLWLPLRALKSIFHRRTPGY